MLGKHAVRSHISVSSSSIPDALLYPAGYSLCGPEHPLTDFAHTICYLATAKPETSGPSFIFLVILGKMTGNRLKETFTSEEKIDSCSSWDRLYGLRDWNRYLFKCFILGSTHSLTTVILVWK